MLAGLPENHAQFASHVTQSSFAQVNVPSLDRAGSEGTIEKSLYVYCAVLQIDAGLVTPEDVYCACCPRARPCY